MLGCLSHLQLVDWHTELFFLLLPRFLAWPAIMFSLNSMFNQHPVRSKGEISIWSNLMYVPLVVTLILEISCLTHANRLCISALLASYIPMVIISRSPTPAPAP